jgi:hypothetical protein
VTLQLGFWARGNKSSLQKRKHSLLGNVTQGLRIVRILLNGLANAKWTYQLFVGRLVGKIPLRRPRSRWEDNITIDLNEIGWEVLGWIHLVQNRDLWCALVNTIMNLRVS